MVYIKASATLKTAENSTHPLGCKMALRICKRESKKRQKNNMKGKQVLFQSPILIASSCPG